MSATRTWAVLFHRNRPEFAAVRVRAATRRDALARARRELTRHPAAADWRAGPPGPPSLAPVALDSAPPLPRTLAAKYPALAGALKTISYMEAP